MNIPLLDLKAQYKSIKHEIDEAIREVMESGSFILSKHVKEFESKFSDFCGAKYCVGVGNGTDALYLSLRTYGIGPGDEVITVPNTFFASAEAIIEAGAWVTFVDIDAQTHNIDVDKLSEYIETQCFYDEDVGHLKNKARKTRIAAILPVHLYGQPIELKPILELAKRYKILLIEDAAQAHGAEYHGKKVGTFGNTGCFSFYPGKNLGAYGDAGAIITNDAYTAEKLSLLRNHGRKSKYEHEVSGYNSRIDEMQAAILLVKLKHLKRWNQERQRIAEMYNHMLRSVEEIETPKSIPGIEHVYHLYVIMCEQRDKLQQFLKDNGVATGIHYPLPLHLQKPLKVFGYQKGDFPCTETNSKRILSLPIYPELGEEQFNRIVKLIKQFLAKESNKLCEYC